MLNIAQQIASELGVREQQIQSTIELLNEGATIPFIARYRKEVTGELDDTQLRTFETRYLYLQDLEARKQTILNSISEQGKLTPELEEKIANCLVKSDLEDIYLPFKPKRQTNATKAKDAGLEPLAFTLFTAEDPDLDVEKTVAPYLVENYPTTKDALTGALHIMMDHFAENADLIGELKSYMKGSSQFKTKVIADKEAEGQKFKDYFDFAEDFKKLKSHRIMAMLRARKEGIVSLSVDANPLELPQNPAEEIIKRFALGEHQVDLEKPTELNRWRQQVLSWLWKVKLSSSLENFMITSAREQAEEEAIKVFAENLRALLLASPAKAQTVLGLDPGIRTGVKAAVVDQTSKILETGVLYTNFKNDIPECEQKILGWIKDYGVTLISIGNGTASRETERFVRDLLTRENIKNVSVVITNEAGASVYSASPLAAEELPELDVSLRGAVSIARRLQDPLAELVKITPRSIGVGLYQHDLPEAELDRNLDAVVEDCVNFVGVDVNTASTKLLERVAGVKKNIAANIVKFRDENGPFKNRKELMNVPRLGAKAFEQCAGFLRVVDGDYVLDNSAVHPETYAIVEKMAADLQVSLSELVGNGYLVRKINPESYVTDKVGLPTIKDILSELQKPGRDPRGEFETVKYLEGVETIADLVVGMELEGLVTNVSTFGAFVDIGVHQDGLVHTSEMSNVYVNDPQKFLKPGQKVKVQVLKVDVERNRIDLTMNFKGSTTWRQPEPKPARKAQGKLTKPTKPTTKTAQSLNSAQDINPSKHKGKTVNDKKANYTNANSAKADLATGKVAGKVTNQANGKGNANESVAQPKAKHKSNQHQSTKNNPNQSNHQKSNPKPKKGSDKPTTKSGKSSFKFNDGLAALKELFK